MKNLTILLLFFLSLTVVAQNDKTYSYESSELIVKPSPTAEFNEWLATNNEKIGKAAPYNTKKTTKVTLVFTVDVNGNIIDPKIWRGIGQGYDEYAYKLIKNNPFKWVAGQISNNINTNTEVYFQLDYIKNDNKVMNKENKPIK